MKILVTLLALLATTASATLAQSQWDEEVMYNRSYDRWYSWIEACELTGYPCSEIQIPTVVYEPMRKYLHGWYGGGLKVYVNETLYGTQRRATIIHEMVHYLHAAQGIINVPGWSKEICWSENEAFTLVDKWWVSIGWPEKQRGPYWWRPYTHCWPYYHDQFDFWLWIDKMIEEAIDDIIDRTD